ncbi:DegT/DnrJ/EryC1/StrS family aminotransferase [Embleya sp. NBC_00888]|uniref:DegT/DnrJ/EryC1/StrS family aminotransferase n=1 Tax=Embleya sp. NBC_00888 TaxID=2975960 RepID=UPI0038660A38|nr:DegT/DnrJ/EryC1/StrS family aminotransferase [Embleya sp. NBC_00888]
MAVTGKPAVLGGDATFAEGLPLTRVHVPEREELARRLDTILTSGQLTDGATVRELEEDAAARLEVPYVVAVSNCTSGLMLALQALGVSGSVAMPGFTFAATAHAAHWAGATPVFAEVDPDSLTLDATDAAALLAESGASALMATHVYGTPCRVEELAKVADDAGVPIVYDAAHALGSRRAGTPIGGFGAAEVFSLSPTKVVTAGEGGLIATRDEGLAQACRLGRGYGNPGDYDCLFPGLNARMSELHAALALVSLRGLPERVATRSHLVGVFADAIADVPGLRLPMLADGDVSTWKDLTLIVDPDTFGLDTPTLARALKADGIDSRRYFHPPVNRQKAYAHLPARPLPITDDVSSRVLTLPLWSHMDEPTVRRVADTVIRLHEHAADVRIASV